MRTKHEQLKLIFASWNEKLILQHQNRICTFYWNVFFCVFMMITKCKIIKTPFKVTHALYGTYQLILFVVTKSRFRVFDFFHHLWEEQRRWLVYKHVLSIKSYKIEILIVSYCKLCRTSLVVGLYIYLVSLSNNVILFIEFLYGATYFK